MRVTISVGGRFHAFNLAEELQKRGHLKSLITSYPKSEVQKYGIPREKVFSNILAEVIGRTYRKLPGFLRSFGNPQYLNCEVFDKWASNKVSEADICVAWSSYALHTLRAAKKTGAVTIVERGSSHISFQHSILKEEYEKFGLKPRLGHPKVVLKEIEEYKEADFISIPSLYVKRTFLEKGFPESKLIHVPYGVDLSAFRQVTKEDDKFRVIFAGGMSLRKGVHYLLQAFTELDLPNSELMLIGSLNDEIKPFFKKYEGKFNYLGHVPQRELYKYYSQGSVFCLMSIEEGLAMVQPQAMACGLPVICTTNTGGEDIVRDGLDGFVIPIRDVDALKEKLLYLYKNSERRLQMGRSAKERVSAGFTWNDYGSRIVDAYKKILND